MKLRVGILGAARVATYAMIAPARALGQWTRAGAGERFAEVEVAAIAARDPERARAFAETHGIPRVHRNYAALCGDPAIDLVYVATPPRFHLEQALLAIGQGKHVLVEKPFAMDAAEAARLLQAAAARGVRVFEAMHSLYHPIWIDALGHLPALGTLRRVEAVFDTPVKTDATEFRWEAGLGGGALMDLGVYPLAWTRLVAGEPLMATDVTFRRERGADAAFSAELWLPRGVRARVSADMAAPFRAELRLTGAAGTMTLVNPLAPQRGGRLELEVGGQRCTTEYDGPGTYDIQLMVIAAALLQGGNVRFWPPAGDPLRALPPRLTWPLPADDPLRSMQAIDRVRSAAG